MVVIGLCACEVTQKLTLKKLKFSCGNPILGQRGVRPNPPNPPGSAPAFTGKKFTNSPGSPSKLSFGTGSTRLQLLHSNRTSHAHNLDLCKGVARDAAQMQPRERMQLHQLTHGTLLAHTSPPRPFFSK